MTTVRLLNLWHRAVARQARRRPGTLLWYQASRTRRDLYRAFLMSHGGHKAG